MRAIQNETRAFTRRRAESADSPPSDSPLDYSRSASQGAEGNDRSQTAVGTFGQSAKLGGEIEVDFSGVCRFAAHSVCFKQAMIRSQIILPHTPFQKHARYVAPLISSLGGNLRVVRHVRAEVFFRQIGNGGCRKCSGEFSQPHGHIVGITSRKLRALAIFRFGFAMPDDSRELHFPLS